MNQLPQGLPDSGRGYALPESGQPKYHTGREVPSTIHEGPSQDDCPRCSPPGAAEPDVVGRLIDVLDQLERIAGKGAEGLENLSVIISQRIHFVELLDRAAALIDPDVAPPTHEQRLDWLAKWRETVGR